MAGTTPVGAISIGSNDIHLLVAISDGTTTFERQMNQSMLAELVSAQKQGILPASALSSALHDLETLVVAARSTGANPIIALATEALREAANGAAFAALAGATFGIQTALLSGEEEAALDYTWATFPVVPSAPLLVVDSGGGSTQVIQGNGHTPSSAISLPIGAGNMTRQFLAHDPPTKDELQALREYIAGLVVNLPIVLSLQSAVLMGGSADHLLQFSVRKEQQTVTLDDLHRALHELHTKAAKEIARDYQIPVERARLLPAGAEILRAILVHFSMQIAQVKANGIRGGWVITYARYGESWRQALPLPPAEA